MSLLITHNKKLSDFPKRLNHTKRLVGEHRRFSIGLSPGLWGWKKRRICKKILNPLLLFIELAAVYDLKTDTPQFKKISPYVKRRNSRHELDLAGRTWQDFLPILYKPRVFSTIHEIRSSILLACKNGDIPWDKIFREASGPFVVGNPSVGCGTAVLQYTERNLDKGLIYIVIEKINSGLESITIISERNTVLRLFDLATQICQWLRIDHFDIEAKE
ncbi:MAG: hypothetical protein JW943_06725 [Deltaproteobacteria bacterium]|nr:hypothetical protein [Deltaproteobacteria bacterium]